MERNKRRSRPALEGLEGRALLSASRALTAHAEAATTTATTAVKRLDYTTPQGAKVHIGLIGPGTLAGSTVGPDGSLSLVYSGTSLFSAITSTVKGGPGVAPLESIRDANVALTSTTGIGGELIGLVSLPKFNLVSGGNINLLGGVNVLDLNSAAAGSQMHLRDTPLNTSLDLNSSAPSGAGYLSGSLATTTTTGYGGNSSSGSSGTGSTASGAATGVGAVATSQVSGVGTTFTGSSGSITGIGTLDPQATGFGGTGNGAVNGAIPIIPTIGNGQNHAGTPGLTQAQVSQGRVVSYAFESDGGIELTGLSGVFTPGSNLIEPRDVSLPGADRVSPPGVILNIKTVNGGPSADSPPLGDPQIYGYDPTANALIRFDATTGARLQTIVLPASAAGQAGGGVALASDGAERVVLVGVGQVVYAYDAGNGAFVGQFGTNGPITGIGTSASATVLASSSAAAGGTGLTQAIDVTNSLATGKAVGLSTPFAPAREFNLAGGLTGLPGNNNLYALGSAHFDSAVPDTVQAGVITLNASSDGTIFESTRTELTSGTGEITANANGTIPGDPSSALGSIESDLALVTGVTGGRNVVALLNPSTLGNLGTVALDDADPLTDLSESFHPEIANTALIDVQGNLQSFTAKSVNGLVLNDAGNLNLFAVGRATDTSVVGLPFGHVDVPASSDLSIVTNSRLVGTRGGVAVNPGQQEVGPLALP